MPECSNHHGDELGTKTDSNGISKAECSASMQAHNDQTISGDNKLTYVKCICQARTPPGFLHGSELRAVYLVKFVRRSQRLIFQASSFKGQPRAQALIYITLDLLNVRRSDDHKVMAWVRGYSTGGKKSPITFYQTDNECITLYMNQYVQVYSVDAQCRIHGLYHIMYRQFSSFSFITSSCLDTTCSPLPSFFKGYSSQTNKDQTILT